MRAAGRRDFAMKIGLVLAATAALVVSGCGIADCSGAANDSAAAGSCGVHATFLASRTTNRPAPALRKS
jgi:hypothetical protein